MKKKSWEPFRSCLLNSTANPAQFRWRWTGLSVLFGHVGQLPNGSHDFFHIFSLFLLTYLIMNPQTTNALTFLTLTILAIGGVLHFQKMWQMFCWFFRGIEEELLLLSFDLYFWQKSSNNVEVHLFLWQSKIKWSLQRRKKDLSCHGYF